MKTRARIVPTLAWVLLAVAASAGAPRKGARPASGDEDWVSTFYAHQRVKELPAVVARLARDGTLEAPQARAPIAAFLSVLFRRKDVDAEALVSGAEVSPRGREALLDALWMSGRPEAVQRIARAKGIPVERWLRTPPDLATLPLEEPSHLDMMWGAFLAGGDVLYVRRIVDVLDRAPATDVPGKLLFGAARWSLGSNARQHAPVLGLVREEARVRTGPARPVLEEILAELDRERATGR